MNANRTRLAARSYGVLTLSTLAVLLCTALVAAYLLTGASPAGALSGTLVPTSDKANTGAWVDDGGNACGASGTQCSEEIDEDIDSPVDSNDYVRKNDQGSGGSTVEFHLTDPGLAQGTYTLHLRVRARENPSDSSNGALRAQLFDNTNTQIADLGTVSLTGSFTNYEVYVTNQFLTVAQINGLYVRLTASRDSGGNTPDVDVSTVNVDMQLQAPNPVLSATCGIDLMLVIDSSGSIDASELQVMKDAFNNFVDLLLPATPTQIAIVEFDTQATLVQGFTNNTTLLHNAINAAASGGRTNWDDALYDARQPFPHRALNPDMILFASDGNPNEVGGHESNLTPDEASIPAALIEGIDEANKAKAAGIRIVSLGIGGGSGQFETLNPGALQAISSVDAYFETASFDDLGQELEDLANNLCGGTITVTKVIDADGNPSTTNDQTPAQGWTFTTNVDAPDTATPPSGQTDANGQINFDINLGQDNQATVDVTETLQANHAFVTASCTSQQGAEGTPGTLAVNNISVGPNEIINCKFVNKAVRTFTVDKNYSNGAAGPDVSISLSCSGGATVTNSPQTANHNTNAVFIVEGGDPNGANVTCTATEQVPSGYTPSPANGQCFATLAAGSCTITNTLNQNTFTVDKNYVPNTPAGPDLSITLSCPGATVTNSPQTANHSTNAVFTVTGAANPASITCTASEGAVPAGYNSPTNGSCSATLAAGTCTITNNLNTATVLVNKDFVPDNASDVTVSLTCTSGNVANDDTTASETDPANFTVTGFTPPATCTATESPVPSGYTVSYSAGCTNMSIAHGQQTNTCTITNTLNSTTFTVDKNYVPNTPVGPNLSITLSCPGATVTNSPQTANHTTNAVFTVQGFANTSVTCNASEGTVPAGYNSPTNGTCSATLAVGTCTITNNLNTATVKVFKDFVPNNAADVTVELTCSSGTVANTDSTASEADPANFTVTGFTPPATCTATENPVPSGYTVSYSAGCTNMAITHGNETATCTITNTLKSIQFTVHKDWTPDNPQGQVSVLLTCTNLGPNGAISSPNPATITGDGSATWTVTGWSGADPGCTATESPVPNGYISNESCVLSTTNTQCTITNTLNQGSFQVDKDFTDPSPPLTLQVPISLTCTGGATVTNSPQNATHNTNAVFNVTGPQTGSCTATETVPSGYTGSNGGQCTATQAVGICTITNTPKKVTFTVIKDFQPDVSDIQVTVTLVCNALAPNGYIVPNSSQVITGDGQASWDVYAWPGSDPDCHAEESPVPAGYSSTGQCDFPSTTANTCTIVNQKLGKIIVDKVTNPAGDLQTFPVVLSGPTGGSGNVTDAANLEFDNRQPGIYSLSEMPVPGGWQFTGGSCSDGSPLNAIDLSLQETITCTLNNVKLGAVIVQKTTNPAGATTQFPVSLTGQANGFITDATDHTYLGLLPGQYTLSETLSVPWVQTGLSCTHGPNTGVTITDPPVRTAQITLAAGDTVTCVFTNTTQDDFTVHKDFSDGNTSAVDISLACSSGTVTVTKGTASDNPDNPATFIVQGFNPDSIPSCTATESNVPSGYIMENGGQCTASLSVGSCTITNTLTRGTFTVKKVFSDGSTASVFVDFSCASGTTSPGGTQEVVGGGLGTLFVITGYSGDPTCTATETSIPAGYNSTGSCSAPLSAGECTIFNDLNTATFTVHKDFSDDNSSQVNIFLTCSNGNIDNPNKPASDNPDTPAVFTVTAFVADPDQITCTATETTVLSGYTSTVFCSASLAAGQCTIYNTLNEAGFVVFKDYQPDGGPDVTVTLDCGPGVTVTPASAVINEGNPAFFNVSGFDDNPLCTATEDPIPAGYASSGECSALLLGEQVIVAGVARPQGTSAPSVGCTITNTLRIEGFQVLKNFVPDNPGGSVNVTLSCTSGQVSPASGQASEGSPASFTVTGASGDPICTATETSIPDGYTSTGVCQASLSTGFCVITNTRSRAEFIVRKDFSDDSPEAVNVSLSCTSGSVSPSGKQPLREAVPAVFVVDGYTGDPVCTATEDIPPAYESTGTCSAAISTGECTIVNTVKLAQFTVFKDFQDNNPEPVMVTLLCNQGYVDPLGPQPVSESSPFTWMVTGYQGFPTCAATEAPIPDGYSSTGTCEAALLTAGSCTIVNNIRTASPSPTPTSPTTPTPTPTPSPVPSPTPTQGPETFTPAPTTPAPTTPEATTPAPTTPEATTPAPTPSPTALPESQTPVLTPSPTALPVSQFPNTGGSPLAESPLAMGLLVLAGLMAVAAGAAFTVAARRDW